MANADKFEEGTRALREWYWDEVRSLAAEALEEFPLTVATEDDDEPDDENEQERNEWIEQTIDGHEFIIYTYKAQAVLLASDSDGAYEEEFGEPAKSYEQAAYMAMLTDVREQLAALVTA